MSKTQDIDFEKSVGHQEEDQWASIREERVEIIERQKIRRLTSEEALNPVPSTSLLFSQASLMES